MNGPSLDPIIEKEANVITSFDCIWMFLVHKTCV